MTDLRAPFPWFGGKRRVAGEVWAALGDVDNYVEPFAGSLAVLLGRPAHHVHTTETVNDADQYLSNFWRALAADPEAVAAHADWPVNEADLFARHLWLVNEGRGRLRQMDNDPEFYDAKVAGWWVWGVCAWIGSGWCSGTGPHTYGDPGRGVNRQLPHLGDPGRGVNRQLPHLGNPGRGVNRKRPHLGTPGQGPLLDYFEGLAARLRRVRVCCGDWTRVVTTGALNYGTTAGIFLDPPYSGDVRASDLYAVDDHTISHDVRRWAIANGDNPRLRIVLAGYRQEHDEELPPTWRRLFYSASKSYGTTNAVGTNTGNDANRHNEALWFSPHCLDAHQQDLFGEPA